MKYQKGQFIVIPNKDTIKGKPPTLQCVYFWVCSFADEQGYCYPSIKTISYCAGCTTRVTIKYLKELEKLGILIKENRFKGNEKISNLYQIMVVEQNGLLLKVTRGSEPKSQGGSEPKSHRTISNLLTKTNNEPIDIIRKLYPHVTGRSNKKKSSTILQKLLEDFNLETIQREIQLLKLNIEIGQQNPSFVPGLQVWLNNFSVTLPNVYVKTISLYRQLHKEDKNKEALYKRWMDNYPQQRKLGTEEFRKSQSINLSSFK